MNMKKKITALLVLALIVSLLGGCGGSSQTEKGTANNSSGKKSKVLSEYLSKEKVIAYQVGEMDKAKTPDKIYFFEDGKLTIIPGKEFGLTMGDFAKMTDKEIWKEYESVREKYKEGYLTDGRMDELDRYLLEAYTKEEKRSFVNFSSFEELKQAPVILEAVRGKTYAQVREIDPSEVTNSSDLSWGDDLAYTAEVCLKSFWNYQFVIDENGGQTLEPLGDFTEEDLFWRDRLWGESKDNVTFSGEVFEAAVAQYKKAIEKIEKLQKEIKYHGPFYDLPFTFVVETDPSGNNVANEKLVYPTLADNLGEPPADASAYIQFGNAEGADVQIYDTTYSCLGLSTGDVFCSRAPLKLDTVKSKKVSIDLSKDEINELFEEEVSSRYK